MFVIKKIVGGLLMPLPVLGLFSFIMLLIAFKNRKSALVISTLSLAVLLAISTPFVASRIIEPNEPISLAFNRLKQPSIDKIIVLGCDVNPNAALSANNQLGNCALTRLVEGIKLAKYYPQAQLIVSGGGYNMVTNSSLMYKTAISLGVNKARISQNPYAMDTAAEARLLAPQLIDYNVALVTSVLHMPRAKGLFNAQGIDVIPAATDYHNFSIIPMHKQFVPSAHTLMVVTQYCHEMIGNAWIGLRRFINPESV
ncbi:YdcF family protein [Pseudoalteromonas sp. MMG010]|uniref:YdcF family protein n=1 Tax=Pseudoalteromonas sp. MMG010 TaxID=2822685 RepID=UPI001B39EB8F|nr:ElyC/SanA/YdcF family protein [Pseudoalteromonas sp. MMG010]MBQ4833267.1 YdcF family protein [Pseudoalteromonas sp. MMG010]